jgi:rhamnosyltransferase
MMKVCAGITFYHPDSEQIERVRYYSKIFDFVFVVDNSDYQSVFTDPFYSNFHNVKIVHSGVNIGLSSSLNILCKTAFSENFDFICLIDQDSLFQKDSIKTILSLLCVLDLHDVCILAPTVLYQHESYKLCRSKKGCDLAKLKWVITSGSFINLNLFSVLNGFDDAYFIDRIDYDFCSRAIDKGFSILQSKRSFIFQQLGAPIQGAIKIGYEHSPLRNYYSFRNRYYFYRFKSSSPLYRRILAIFFGSIVQIIKIVFIESHKIKKIVYIAKGIRDCYRGKYGKLAD